MQDAYPSCYIPAFSSRGCMVGGATIKGVELHPACVHRHKIVSMQKSETGNLE